jgi:mono/diheme cytochrome c family protein
MALIVGTVTAAQALANDTVDRTKVTFTKDVLPILQENCQDCHRTGGANLGGMVAPMAFVTYQEVRPWAKAIAREVQARNMPPWDASPEFHGVFKNERSLNDDEIATLVAWAATGAVKGNPKDAPKPLTFPDSAGWQIGTPDLVVEMPEKYFVADDVEDLYVTFDVELTEEQLPEDRYIKAIEFRPGSSVVHHIISDPLGGLAPGNDPTVFADGYYQVLRKGSAISFQMHYHKEPGPGTGVWDRSSAAVKFYPKGEQPEHRVRTSVLGHQDFKIPAGDSNYTDTVEESFDHDIEIISFSPHMHLRGKSAQYRAKYADGNVKALLDVPDYDFNWQTSYEFKEPPVLPAGTKIHLTMAWDNSAENPFNPDPSADVVFGQPTTDEMMFGFMRFAYLDEPEESEVDAAALAAYAGTYKFDVHGGTSFTIALKGGRLMADFPGNPPFPIATKGQDEFEFALANMILKFERNDDGEVHAVVMHNRGEVHRATKADEE